jgi:hypothetical protein
MLLFSRTVCVVSLVLGLANVSSAAITGDYLEARTCDVYTGPCFANAELGLTGDQGILAWRVKSGKWNGIDISGLSVVAAIKASDTLGDQFTKPYPTKSVLMVDERANSRQRSALVSFAKTMGGQLVEDVVRIDSVPIVLEVGCCGKRACASLTAGNLVSVETRCATEKDHVCGNEEVYYLPLAKVNKDYVPAVTVSHRFNGKGLNSVWSSPNKRSAFVASFTR